MAEEDLRDLLRRAQEDARLAREAARLAQKEAREMAGLVRDQARDAAKAARDAARKERHDRRHHSRPAGDPAGPWGFPNVDDPRTSDEPPGAEVREDLNLDGVSSVRIDQSAGKLTVRACAEGESPGVIAASNKTPPQLLVSREGDRLEISIRQNAGWLFRRRHGATSVVRLRGDFAVIKASLGYGDLQLRDLVSATMDLDVGAGTVNLYSVRSDVKANVGAGRIALHDHAGLARCETGTGDIQVDVAEAVPGEYRAAAGMGRAEFQFPPGLTLNTKANSGIGRAKIDYPAGGDSAPIQVRIETGIGEAAVRVRKSGNEPARPPAPPSARSGGFAPQRARRQESEELRVLQLLEQGRISSQEAAELLAALQGAPPPLDEDDGLEG
jgi:hypothetical protein